MKAIIKTEVGDIVIEGTVEEFRELFFPRLNATHLFIEKEIQESLIRLPLKPPLHGYTEYFRSKGTARGSNQKARTYIYYKNDDGSYIVHVVDHEGILKARWELGSLNDPESRIGKVVKALSRLPRDKFTVKELFSYVENGWWRNRWSRMKCAIDILMKERLIERVSEPPTVPVMYRRVRGFPIGGGSEASD